MKGPELDTTPIDIPTTPHRFKDYLVLAPAQNGMDGTEIPTFGDQLKPIPSSHELALIRQEMVKLADQARDNLKQLQTNQETLTQWIKRHDPEGTIQTETIRKIKLKIKDSSSKNEEVSPVDSGDYSVENTPRQKTDLVDDQQIKTKTGENGIKLSITGSGLIKIAGGHASTPKTAESTPTHSTSTTDKKSKKLGNLLRKDKIKKKSDRDSMASARSTPEIEAAAAKGDYSKAKVQQNQIPVATFWSFMDQFFRQMTAEDLKNLESNGDETTPMMIPTPGVHFREQWKEEDIKMASLLEDGLTNASLAMNKEYFEMDDTVYEGDVSMGPLSERLLGAFAKENVVAPDLDDDDTQNSITNKFVVRGRTKYELCVFEDRLKAELMHIGLLPKEQPDTSNEITTMLLSAQNELRDVLAVNAKRKKKLKSIADEYMAYQEYNHLLDDINKAIENAYIKRFKSNLKKPKKKIGARESSIEPPQPVDSFVQLLQNRKKLIEEVGNVYFPSSKFEPPTNSIYADGSDMEQD